MSLRLVFLCLCLLGMPLMSVADTNEWKSEGDVPLERCDLQTVAMFHSMRTLNNEVAIGTVMMPMIDEFQRLANKAPISNRPVGEQLNTKDRDRMNELSQRMLAMRFQGLVESKRKRDVDVIKRLVQIADQNYRFGTVVPEGHSDYLYQSTIDLLRGIADGLAKDQHQFTKPSTSVCSMDLALYLVESEAVKKAASIDLVPELERMQAIAKKNGMIKIDREKLSKIDRDSYDRIMIDRILPFQRAQQFMDDLENIRVMARASEIIFTNDKRDLEISGGDGAKLGATTADRVKKNEYDLRTQASLGLWYSLNEKIPSKAATEAAQLSKILNQTQK